jgi:kumamolisin
MPDIPANYRRLDGSERHRAPGTRQAGPADPKEVLTVTILLRRRPGAPALPTPTQLSLAAAGQGKFITREGFGAKYGASPEDLDLVASFARTHDLTVIESSVPRRTLLVSGTAEQLSRAFAVDLDRYESSAGTYRGREGYVYVPNNLEGIVQGIFGLDNRKMAKPLYARVVRPEQIITALTPPQVAGLYNFPSSLDATGQTIGLLEFGGGYNIGDIQRFFSELQMAGPTPITVGVDGATNAPGNAQNPQHDDIEVTLDIDVAGSAAPGAGIVVYFAPATEQGWVDAATTAIHDVVNKPSVLSISWGWPELVPGGWSRMGMDAVSLAFLEAALLGVTVFAASGDDGSSCDQNDNRAHVLYPASDPGVTICGGTSIADVSGSSFSEKTWPPTGGGISYNFPLPSWQNDVGVPLSVNGDGHVGRGTPDIAGNADPGSGYELVVYGEPNGPFGGTSAISPLYAGLVARINAYLGQPIGYLNPFLYSLGNSNIFRDINDGASNGAGGAPGYSTGPGWDACTGWGSINGESLLTAFIPPGRKINSVDCTPDALAACVFQSKLFLFWKANDPSNSIYFSVSADGNAWPAGQRINAIDITPESLTASVFQNQLFLFWKANDPSNSIYFGASADGSTWPPGQRINDVDSTPDSPEACVFQSKLFLFWKANDASNSIYFSASTDGSVWPPGQKINDADSTPESLAACVFQDQLFLFWKANDASNSIYFSASRDGSSWPLGQKINDFDSTPESTAACVFGSELYLLWKANDPSNSIYFSPSTDGKTWPVGRKINNIDSTPDSPTACLFTFFDGTRMHLFWDANDPSRSIYFTHTMWNLFR